MISFELWYNMSFQKLKFICKSFKMFTSLNYFTSWIADTPKMLFSVVGSTVLLNWLIKKKKRKNGFFLKNRKISEKIKKFENFLKNLSFYNQNLNKNNQLRSFIHQINSARLQWSEWQRDHLLSVFSSKMYAKKNITKLSNYRREIKVSCLIICPDIPISHLQQRKQVRHKVNQWLLDW